MSHHGHHRSRREHGGSGAGAVRSRAFVDVEQAASYLEALAQALRAGGVTIRSGSKLVALSVDKNVSLKLDAGEDGQDSVVTLELRWETPVPEERLEIVSGIEQGGSEQDFSPTPDEQSPSGKH